MPKIIIAKENIAEEAYLSNHEDFVNVNNIYYGGYQRWLYTEKLRLKFWADRSCGLTAVSNSLIHMSLYNHRLQNLYTYPSLSKSDFANFMNHLYDYIKPTIIGIPTLGKLKKGVVSFGKSRDLALDYNSLNMPRDMDKTVNFIKEALMIDSPIMMLTWNTKIKNLGFHWVTITGYMKTIDGKNYVITSNWADKEIFSLDEWINRKTFYRGLIYFMI